MQVTNVSVQLAQLLLAAQLQPLEMQSPLTSILQARNTGEHLQETCCQYAILKGTQQYLCKRPRPHLFRMCGSLPYHSLQSAAFTRGRSYCKDLWILIDLHTCVLATNVILACRFVCWDDCNANWGAAAWSQSPAKHDRGPCGWPVSRPAGTCPAC